MSEIGTALVTGGARRVGRAIVEALAAAGYAVAIHANRSQGEAEELARHIVGAGGRAAVVTADLAEPADVDGLVARACAAVGPLTLLVNNASEFAEDHLGSLTREVWNRQFRVNIQTPSFLAQDFAAQAPAGASIVNITDQRVLKPTPQFYSYALTKAALAAATVAMAQALAPRIRVNAVAPGPSLQGHRQGPEDFARQTAATLTRTGSPPDEIARAVLYLAGATAVTGVTIPVDGGQHLIWQTPDVDGVRE
ncbi:MAG: SDR family oxidoreductase [Phreatobacter sp.]|uniref:SDR family oxidoreductase n=1 Tax=Phreatobacter sp. TaxID=1966341 RepID=UPI0027349DFB|nr:SDR family oxidoreductase [Phreatobacter sp.]MDP2800328.1 SDR family oxidoreductase [Phreatobacter sp.]